MWWLVRLIIIQGLSSQGTCKIRSSFYDRCKRGFKHLISRKFGCRPKGCCNVRGQHEQIPEHEIMGKGHRVTYAAPRHKGVRRTSVVRSSCTSRISVIALLCFFPWLGCVRVGEAMNPGPGELEDSTWQFGIFNASGLNSKTDQIAHLHGHSWVGSETHLTSRGIRNLKNGLAALQSGFKYVVPGEPCNPRGISSDVGTFAGVVLLSKFPSRKIPHDFGNDLMSTSRIQVAGMFVSGYWVQIGMCYGYPTGASHRQPVLQTELLLDALITRIGCQASGPRIVCGDFNHEPSALAQTERLRDLGFKEAQEIASLRWGLPELPTGRGDKKIDQLWLSVELQALLTRVEVLQDQWADHASVVASFAKDSSPLYEYRWFVPQPIEWPQEWITQGSYDTSLHPAEAYATMWNSFEKSAVNLFEKDGQKIPYSKLGRGQTMSVKAVLNSPAPNKVARQGDLQPGFLGTSIKHARWFRQLRRLQALTRMIQCQQPKPNNHIKALELWSAIRNASGFEGGFGMWWKQFGDPGVFAEGLSVLLPSPEQIYAMFTTFKSHVKAFETSMAKKKYHGAKKARQHDLNYVFRDCQKEGPSKVDSLVQTTTAIIDTVQQDDSSVTFLQDTGFCRDRPLVGEGKVFNIIESHNDQVWLEDLQNLAPGSELRQEVVACSDADILKQFEEVWQPRWTKLTHITMSQWEQIFSFAQAKLPKVKWSFPEWTVQQFRTAVTCKKARSATGPDGISKRDLLALSDEGVEAILDLYRSVENGAEWPPQVATGFVSSLDKQRGDGWVDSYRPVTIYSMVYRVWSSSRARSALKDLSQVLPNSVRGGVPARQAKSVWYELSQLIESAHCTGDSLQGILVDIKRAFNALPRLPVWQAMHCMNFPPTILVAWASFVASQQRRFRVRNSAGNGLRSCVGFPEGCAMSVFAMTIIDWLMELWIQSQVIHPTSVISYVDDWQAIFGQPHDFGRVWEAILSFAQALDLEIDINKSCLWAAHSEDRAILKQHPLGTVLAARDLGAHQNFCRRSGNATVTQRIAELTPFWKKLRMSLSPLAAKLQALVQAAWPRSLHAVSVVHLGHNHFVKLRSGAAFGLNCKRVGSNPVALLATFPSLCDPEQWAIAQTIRDARELSCHHQIESLLASLCHGDIQIPSNGPTVVLARRLARLGWKLDDQGYFNDCVGSFSILTSHWDSIKRRITWSWPKLMAVELSHRQTFAGIQNADLEEVSAGLKRFCPSDQAYLRCNLDGTLFIDLDRPKEERSKHRVCAACGQADSFFHQHWECNALKSCRAGFPFMHLLSSLPPCLVNHGWPIMSLAWIELQRHFDTLPDLTFDVSRVKWPLTTTLDLFVDGSCQMPKEPKFRFASWAITIATGQGSMWEHDVVAFGHVVGHHQTAYRGELTALVKTAQLVQQLGRKARVWSDCQSVVRRARLILQKGTVKANSPHSDLWQVFADTVKLLDVDQLVVCKVTSHGCLTSVSTDLEQWAFWHNNQVDQVAGQWNFTRPQIFWDLWSRAVSQICFSRYLHYEICKVFLSVGRFRHAQVLQPESGEDSTTLEAGGGQERDAGHKDQAFDQTIREDRELVNRSWRSSNHLLRRCLQPNVDVVLKWWTQDGIRAVRAERGVAFWVSGLQIFVDFFLSSGSDGVIIHKGKWYANINEISDSSTISVAQRSKSFLYLWGKLMNENGFHVQKKLQRPQSAALAMWSQCYRITWDSSRLEVIDRFILSWHGRQLLRAADLMMPLSFPQGNRFTFAS